MQCTFYKLCYDNTEFKFLEVVTLKDSVFWVVTLCSTLKSTNVSDQHMTSHLEG
jgi:hypothetical protein